MPCRNDDRLCEGFYVKGSDDGPMLAVRLGGGAVVRKPPETNARSLGGFRRGLTEIGYVEGKNLTIEYRWGQNDFGSLPELADDLVQRRVAAVADEVIE